MSPGSNRLVPVDVKELPDDVTALKVIIADQGNSLAEKQNEIIILREQVTLLKKELFGRKSEKMSPEETRQVLLFNEIEQYASGEDTAEDVPVKKHRRRNGKKQGRKGLPEHLPRKKIIHDLPEEEKAGRQFIGTDKSEVLTIIPEQVYVETHLYLKYALPEGVEIEGEPAVKTAPREARLIPKGIASAALVAYVLVAKFCDALPLYRLEKIFTRWGVEIRRQTMSNWAIFAAKRCERLMELLWEEVPKGRVIRVDETPVQVLGEPNRENTTKSYMWLVHGGPPDTPVVLFTYRETREAKFLIKLLAGHDGVLLTDGYAAYNEVARELGVVHAGCMDHARRKFKDASTVSGGKSSAANSVLNFMKRLYATERYARKNKLSPEKLLELRRTTARRLGWFKRWCDKMSIRTPPKSALGKAIKYTLNQWPKLIRFLDDADIPISNILAENAIRPFVLGRKNWLFCGSPRGAKASAIHYSLIETAKANGLEPYWYLRYLFEKLPLAQNDDDLRALLPTRVTMEEIQNFFRSGDAA